MSCSDQPGRWRWWRRAAAVQAVVLALASLPAAAAAPESVLSEPQAMAHFERAQAAFDRDDYAAAIPELKAAYAIEPNPMLLYAWAQAERFSGDCRRALELYRRYLQTDPAEQQRQLTETNIVDCQAELGESPGADPDDGVSDDGASTSGAVTDPTGDDSAGSSDAGAGPKPWYKDWLAPTLGGAGLAAAGVGGALVALSVRQGADAPKAITQMDYFAEGDAARAKHTAGWVLIGVGGALVVGAAIRYAVLATRPRKKQARVVPGFGGASASLLVRF